MPMRELTNFCCFGILWTAKKKGCEEMKRILACILLLVYLVAGCSTENKLVGKWEREGDRLILNEDYTGDLSGYPITWMYTNEELQIMYAEGEEKGMSVAFTVKFDGSDKLTLISAGEYGMEAEFSRVEE